MPDLSLVKKLFLNSVLTLHGVRAQLHAWASCCHQRAKISPAPLLPLRSCRLPWGLSVASQSSISCIYWDHTRMAQTSTDCSEKVCWFSIDQWPLECCNCCNHTSSVPTSCTMDIKIQTTRGLWVPACKVHTQTKALGYYCYVLLSYNPHPFLVWHTNQSMRTLPVISCSLFLSFLSDAAQNSRLFK